MYHPSRFRQKNNGQKQNQINQKRKIFHSKFAETGEASSTATTNTGETTTAATTTATTPKVEPSVSIHNILDWFGHAEPSFINPYKISKLPHKPPKPTYDPDYFPSTGQPQCLKRKNGYIIEHPKKHQVNAPIGKVMTLPDEMTQTIIEAGMNNTKNEPIRFKGIYKSSSDVDSHSTTQESLNKNTS